MFDIIVDYPESTSALQDLKVYIVPQAKYESGSSNDLRRSASSESTSAHIWSTRYGGRMCLHAHIAADSFLIITIFSQKQTTAVTSRCRYTGYSDTIRVHHPMFAYSRPPWCTIIQSSRSHTTLPSVCIQFREQTIARPR